MKRPSLRAIANAKGIVQQFEPVVPIIVGVDRTVFAGFEFVMAARELGWSTIKVVRLSALSRKDQRVLPIALARLPELSKMDKDALRSEILELFTFDLDYDVPELLDLNSEEMNIILDPDGDETQPSTLDKIPEAPAAQETVTHLGEVLLLGTHRVICGNSLEAATCDKPMGEKIARIILAYSSLGYLSREGFPASARRNTMTCLPVSAKRPSQSV